jgi:hypothetical protein
MSLAPLFGVGIGNSVMVPLMLGTRDMVGPSRRSPSAPCYPIGMAHALRATVRAGHLVVDEPVDLPEGTVVDVVPISQTAHPRPKFGSARGRVQMAPDFDAPLDDFADYVP